MPKGVEVFVDEGFATIGVPDREKRGEVLSQILENTPKELVEKLTRSGPHVLYRIPEGNARAAGLVDGDTSTPPADRKDLGRAQDLVDADPQVSDRGGQHGEYRTPMTESTVRGLAHQAMPTTTGPVGDKDVNSAPQEANGIVTGPLRPNKNVADGVTQVPEGATITSADLLTKIRENTPRPASYAPGRVPRNERVPAVVGTIASVVNRPSKGEAPTNGNGSSAIDEPIEYPEGDPSSSWGRDELDAYALRHHKLDTSGLKNKAEVLKAIKSAGKKS